MIQIFIFTLGNTALYNVYTLNFPPSNNFFQLGNLRHAIQGSAPFLEILTLKMQCDILLLVWDKY